MNPFQRLGVKISNWWRGEPQDSGGVVTLNSPSFLERIGLKRKGKPTSEVTYFTCLKMLSETLAKMPIKYYQKKLMKEKDFSFEGRNGDDSKPEDGIYMKAQRFSKFYEMEE